MAVEFLEDQDGKLVAIRTSGKLTTEDDYQFVTRTEQMINKYGQIRILFDLKHFKDIECFAMAGGAPNAFFLASDETLARLKQGNRRYDDEKSTHEHNLAKWRARFLAKQKPFATVPDCSDSRAPPELQMLLDQIRAIKTKNVKIVGAEHYVDSGKITILEE